MKRVCGAADLASNTARRRPARSPPRSSAGPRPRRCRRDRRRLRGALRRTERWTRPERSTRSRKTSFPHVTPAPPGLRSERLIGVLTRLQRVGCSPYGGDVVRSRNSSAGRSWRRDLGDRDDLVLQEPRGAVTRRPRLLAPMIALPPATVGELARRIRFHRADDRVLEGLVRRDILQADD